MQDTELFTLALGLSSPWEVTQTHLDTENKRLARIIHEYIKQKPLM